MLWEATTAGTARIGALVVCVNNVRALIGRGSTAAAFALLFIESVCCGLAMSELARTPEAPVVAKE